MSFIHVVRACVACLWHSWLLFDWSTPHRLLAEARSAAKQAADDHALAVSELQALKEALHARERQLHDADARVAAHASAMEAAATRERNLIAQVEQLEGEMARCATDKARAVAQAQDAEHVRGVGDVRLACRDCW